MKRALLTSIYILIATAVPAIAAGPADFDLSKSPLPLQHLIGPQKMVFYGINPALNSVQVVINASEAPATAIPSQLVSISAGGASPPSKATPIKVGGPPPSPTPPPPTPMAEPQSLADVTRALGLVSQQTITANQSLVPLRTVIGKLENNTQSFSDLPNSVQADNSYQGASSAFAQIAIDRKILAGYPDVIRAANPTKLGAKKGADITNAIDKVNKAIDTIDKLVSSYPFVARGPVISDFERIVIVDCNALLGGSRTYDIKVTLTDLTDAAQKQESDVTVRCLSRFAYSGGFGFAYFNEKTYYARSANAAVPGPGPSATPAATVQVSSSTGARATVFAFAHYATSPYCDEQCLYYTFGTAIITGSGPSGGNTNLEFGTGFSAGLSRNMFITVGAALGQIQILAPGYSVGTPIAAGASVPTVNQQRLAPFLSITFGGR